MWSAPPRTLSLVLMFFLLFGFSSSLLLVEAVPRHQPGQQEVSAPLALRPATWPECCLPYEHYRSPKHHHPSGFIHHLIHLPRVYQSGSLHHHHRADHHYCSPHHYKVSGTWTHCWDGKKRNVFSPAIIESGLLMLFSVGFPRPPFCWVPACPQSHNLMFSSLFFFNTCRLDQWIVTSI